MSTNNLKSDWNQQFIQNYNSKHLTEQTNKQKAETILTNQSQNVNWFHS